MPDEKRDAGQAQENASSQSSGSVSERVAEASEQAYRRPGTFGQELKRDYKASKKGNVALRVGILVALAVVVAVGVMLVQRWAPPAIENAAAEKIPLAQYARGEIDYATVHVRGDEPYVVQQIPDENGAVKYAVWDFDPSIKLQHSMLSDAYMTGMTLEADGVIEENASDMAQYGLDDPISRITIHLKDGTARTIVLGAKLPSGNGWYVNIEGEDIVYALSSYQGTRMLHTSKDIRDLNVKGAVTLDNVDYVSIDSKDSGMLEMIKGDVILGISAWRVAQPKQLDAAVDVVYEVAGEIAGISLGAYIDSPEDFAPYGLADPAVTCLVKDSDGMQIHYQVGDVVQDNPTLRYVRFVGTDDVYAAQASSLAFIEKTTLARVVDRFAAIVNISNVDKVDFEYGSAKYGLTVEREQKYDEEGNELMLPSGAPDLIETYFIDGMRIDESPFKKIYQTLISVQVRGEIKGEITGSSAARIAFTFNNGSDPIATEYIPYQKDFYAMNQNGVTLFFTTRDVVDSLQDTIQFVKALPKAYEVDAIESMEVRYSDGETKVLTRKGGTPTYRGTSITEERFADAYTRITGVNMQEASVAASVIQPDVVFSIEYTFNDGREPVTMEFREASNRTYAATIPGQKSNVTINRGTIDGEIEYFDKWVK